MVTHALTWQASKSSSAPEVGAGISIVGRAERPFGHATRQQRLDGILEVGDTIWIMGRYQLLSPVAASLIGRIDIEAKTREGNSVSFKASDKSFWLPWNDAGPIIGSIQSLGASENLPLRPRRLAQQLQTTKVLSSSSAESVTSFAEALRMRPVAFLSYSWSRSTDLLSTLLPLLSDLGFGVWVDRWSGPRRFKNEPDPLVEELLTRAVAKSALLISLTGDDSISRKWTDFEGAVADDLAKPMVMLLDNDLRHQLRTGDLRAFLKEKIKERFPAPAVI
ncbi:hypothetical protein [Rhizobium sp. Rhizsp82]|uniref:hypothetical protein n=1 Tax=Rhizobium sp. Rhizsp82 TaxID=3243057 RepID=UPI0039B48B4A